MEENYYSLLLIRSNATDEEIKDAYRALVKFYHPDNNGNLSKGQIEEYENKLNLINEAYEVLSNKDKRNVYDKLVLKSNAESNPNVKEKSKLYDKVWNWYKIYEDCDINCVKNDYGNYFYKLAKEWENKDFEAKFTFKKNQVLGIFFLIIIISVSTILYLNSDAHKTNVLIKELQNKNSNSEYYDKWVINNGEWNYYDSNGKVAVNQWKKFGNDWYYLGEYGEIVKDKFIDNDYYVGEDGRMVVNRDAKSKEDGYWYYFGADGKKIKNDTVVINGIVYSYGPNGRLSYWWDSKHSNVAGATY